MPYELERLTSDLERFLREGKNEFQIAVQGMVFEREHADILSKAEATIRRQLGGAAAAAQVTCEVRVIETGFNEETTVLTVKRPNVAQQAQAAAPRAQGICSRCQQQPGTITLPCKVHYICRACVKIWISAEGL